jgi:hypothetical protein
LRQTLLRIRLPFSFPCNLFGLLVWLLEKVDAKIRFLAFGNQRSVPEMWLEKYGSLVQNVEFYFIDAHGTVEKMNKNNVQRSSRLT